MMGVDTLHCQGLLVQVSNSSLLMMAYAEPDLEMVLVSISSKYEMLLLKTGAGLTW